MSTQRKARKRSTAPLTASSNAAAAGMSDLPHEVLCQVLQHIDIKQRMGICTLVCKAWQQAAMAATTSVSVSISSDMRDSFASWLNSNGSRIEHLAVEGSHKRVGWSSLIYCLKLNFHALARLQSINTARVLLVAPDPGLDTDMAAAAAAAGLKKTRAGTRKAAVAAAQARRQQLLAANSIGALTAVTRLQVSHGGLDIRQLHKCTMLRHLQLDQPSSMHTYGYGSVSYDYVSALPAALQQLVQLTHLNLQTMENIAPALEHLSSLQQLQHLVLAGTNRNSGFGIPPKVLSYTILAGLTHLELKQVFLDGDAAASVLLAALANLLELRHLDLLSVLLDKPGNPAAYSALTAAPQLTYLGLGDCFMQESAWQHMFPVGRRLLQLQHLVAPDYILRHAGSFQSMINCCPNLRQLKIDDHYDRSDMDVAHVYGSNTSANRGGFSELTQLTALTSLSIRWLRISGHFVNQIARLKRLKSLDILHAFRMFGNSLRPLTRLTNLEYLRVMTYDDFNDEETDYASDDGLSCDSDDDPVDYRSYSIGPTSHRVIMENQAPAGCKPDVSKRLKRFCQEYKRSWRVAESEESSDDY